MQVRSVASGLLNDPGHGRSVLLCDRGVGSLLLDSSSIVRCYEANFKAFPLMGEIESLPTCQLVTASLLVAHPARRTRIAERVTESFRRCSSERVSGRGLTGLETVAPYVAVEQTPTAKGEQRASTRAAAAYPSRPTRANRARRPDGTSDRWTARRPEASRAAARGRRGGSSRRRRACR